MLPMLSTELGSDFAAARLEAGVAASRAFVDKRFPGCLAAVLFGSAVSGRASVRSDLDLVVIEKEVNTASHLCTEEDGWRFDVSVRALWECEETVREGPGLWHRDGRTTMLAAWAEGVVIRDRLGVVGNLKVKSQAILKNGPRPLSTREIAAYQQELTKHLDDFLDAEDDVEALFIAFQTVLVSAHLLLGLRRRWSEHMNKWTYRRLQDSDDPLAQGLLDGFARYRQTLDRSQLEQPVDAVLSCVGGRLYEYSDAPDRGTLVRRGARRLKRMARRIHRRFRNLGP